MEVGDSVLENIQTLRYLRLVDLYSHVVKCCIDEGSVDTVALYCKDELFAVNSVDSCQWVNLRDRDCAFYCVNPNVRRCGNRHTVSAACNIKVYPSWL
jgi:hypothetical protein